MFTRACRLQASLLQQGRLFTSLATPRSSPLLSFSSSLLSSLPALSPARLSSPLLSSLVLKRHGSTIPRPLPLPEHTPGTFHPSVPSKVEPKEWKAGSKRVGALGRKIGMTALWDEKGARHPVTVIQLQHTQVVQVRTKDVDGLYALQVGTGRKSTRRMKTKVLNHFAKYGVQPKAYVREFPVTEDALLPPGFEIRAEHFVPGQFIDIQGVSIGKGFQGPMKRWGFAGLPASHGVSVSHRSHGSTGNRQDPGRVWKGKKMAGRMGTDRITVLNLRLVKIDTVLNLLYVRGPVPGPREGYLRLRDSPYKPFPSPPPFPSYIPDGKKLPRELVAPDFVHKPLVHVDNFWQEQQALEKEEKAQQGKEKAKADAKAASKTAKK